MRKIIFKATLFSALMTAFVTTAFASEISYKVNYNYSDSIIKISGNAGEDAKHVTLQILNKDYTFEDLENKLTDSEKIFYIKQIDTNDGEFVFNIDYGSDVKTGEYKGRIVSGNGIKTELGQIRIVSADNYLEAINFVNQYATADDVTNFKNTLTQKYEELCFDNEILEKLTSSDSFAAYMNFVKENPLDKDKTDENVMNFNAYMLMGALNEEVISNIHDYIADTTIDAELYNKYLTYVENIEHQEYITNKMCGNGIKNISELEKSLKTAIILKTIRYADGFDEIKDILSLYGSTVGINDITSNSVYKALSGNDYENAEALLNAYSKLNDNSDSGSGSGSSGKGGSSGRMGGYYPDENVITPQNVTKGFTDIEGVDWAVEAIIALADKGIINGRSDTVFDPDDYVTREEFAKILVGAMGYTNEYVNGNAFSDVTESDWFYKFVNIAYQKKLLNGVGNDMFGTGQFISRQDMSVMIYNALISKNSALPEGEIVFDDKENISGYAKTAVGTLYKMGIINGVSDTEFNPLGNATRAQAAKIVYGVLKQLQ